MFFSFDLPPNASESGQIYMFVVYFYSTFINPFFDILRDTRVLGVSLFRWLFGLTVLSIAVKFFLRFFSSDYEK